MVSESGPVRYWVFKVVPMVGTQSLRAMPDALFKTCWREESHLSGVTNNERER
jgi:hypothetical protein